MIKEKSKYCSWHTKYDTSNGFCEIPDGKFIDLLTVNKFKTKIFSFYFPFVSVTIIFNGTIKKPKILILCIGTFWGILKFIKKCNAIYDKNALFRV